MKQSGISWTDYSGGNLNFVTGCTPISAGCQNCYARAIYERFGKDHSVVKTHPEKLNRLWRKEFPLHSPKRGVPHKTMCFVCDTGDLFHEAVPDEFIYQAFVMMGERSEVTWQVLTKRPERMRELIVRGNRLSYVTSPGENIWLGVTAETQEQADTRIPLLLDTPASVRFVSIEPMLEPVDVFSGYRAIGGPPRARRQGERDGPYVPSLDWVICGAESGPNRRPFDVAWAVDLYEQCQRRAVPYFGKQASGLKPSVPLELPGIGEVKEWPR